MKYYYKSSSGLLCIEMLETDLFVLDNKILDISTDDSNSKFFVHRGETIFLDDWDYIKISDLYDVSENQFFSAELYRFIVAGNYHNSVFRIQEIAGNTIQSRLYKISEIHNKDETNQFRFKVSSCDNLIQRTKLYYTSDFLVKLKFGKITRERV